MDFSQAFQSIDTSCTSSQLFVVFVNVGQDIPESNLVVFLQAFQQFQHSDYGAESLQIRQLDVVLKISENSVSLLATNTSTPLSCLLVHCSIK